MALQRELRDDIVSDRPLDLSAVRLVAGVDVSVKNGRSQAAVVVTTFPDFQPVETALAETATPFPYVPGLLSFREGPVLVEAFAKLRRRPNVFIFDGMGIAHPRRCGIASHLGLWLKTPTIGCGKTLLCGSHDEPSPERGAGSPLTHKGEAIGIVCAPAPGASRCSSRRATSAISRAPPPCSPRAALPAAGADPLRPPGRRRLRRLAPPHGRAGADAGDTGRPTVLGAAGTRVSHAHFRGFHAGPQRAYGPRRVSKEDIISFARAFDPQPFHLGEEEAKGTFVGRLIASGWHTCAINMRLIADGFLLGAASRGAPGSRRSSGCGPSIPATPCARG